ncbi:MAG: DUF5657 family protein [Candidatus Roizmanbacteria bacterium]
MFSTLDITLTWWLVKGFLVVFALLYVLYSAVLLGQIRSLARTVWTETGGFIVAVTAAQLVFAVITLLVMVLYSV